MDPSRLYELVCQVQDQIRRNERCIRDYTQKNDAQDETIATLRVELQQLKKQSHLSEKKLLMTEQEVTLAATKQHLQEAIAAREQQLNEALHSLLYLSHPAPALSSCASLQRYRDHVAAWKEVLSSTSEGGENSCPIMKSRLDSIAEHTNMVREKLQRVLSLNAQAKAAAASSEQQRQRHITRSSHWADLARWYS